MALKTTLELLLFICLIIPGIYCKIPDYIKICSRTNNLQECLMENYKNVVGYLSEHDEPAFKLQNMKEIKVPRIDLQATPDLSVSLADVVFTGVDASVIQSMDFKDNELSMKILCPALNYDGKYNMKGKILILPIEGEGTVHISQKNFVLEYRTRLKIEERKGKKYYYAENNPSDTDIVVSKLEKVIWRFDNLFGGDPRLGPEMNKFLNDNWQDVYNEVKVALEQAGAYVLINPFVNGFLRHIPIDELFKE